MRFSIKRMLILIAVVAAVCGLSSAWRAFELANRAAMYRGMAESLRGQAKTTRNRTAIPGLTAKMVRNELKEAEYLEKTAESYERAIFHPSEPLQLPKR
ncbi:hypothetical protein [Paludisphaera rhizosphaerae]|uniref:hypothetical protein n=1 Tax=Paludisphaera rhizosphaerae TaxID=2711216 RepID=UPI0013E9E8A0|nr:hypothetical protein [Paludisphaera rhizosphaerae]